MAKQLRPDGFDAMLADHKASSHYFEETDGSHRRWSELSAEGKLAYIARDAAFSDVPFERFAAAVRNVLGGLPGAAREEAALRLVLRSEQELHAVAELLPPDERLEGTPLPERVQDALAEARPGPSRAEERPAAEASLVDRLVGSLRECKGMLERVQGEWEGLSEPPWEEIQRAAVVLDEAVGRQQQQAGLTDYQIYDSHLAVIEKPEAFGDAFERLARTAEQKQMAAAFQEFVGDFTGTRGKDAYRQMLAEAASPAGPVKGKDKDQGIDR